MRAVVESLVEAIAAQKRVRLGYRRQADEVTSVHEVAPLDIQPGDTTRTRGSEYLWAWCFAEDKLERHLMQRILRVEILDVEFDPEWVYERWPQGWLRPAEWRVPRPWS